jgi:positive regulator of sigma E activity
MQPGEHTSDDGTSARELIHQISEDVRTITRDEVELLRGEAQRVAKVAVVEGSVILFAGLVAVIGLAMLCVAAVVALAPLIASLTWRLIVMAIVYGVIGGVVAAAFARRLRRDVVPDLDVPVHEARAVVEGTKAALKEGGRHGHA